MFLVISCSMNRGSYSLTLATYALEALRSRSQTSELVDLYRFFSQKKSIEELVSLIEKAACLLIVTPSFSYGVGSGLARLMEETLYSHDERLRKAWKSKVISLISVAVDSGCHQMGCFFLTDLMVRADCWIAPHPVLAVRESFKDKKLLEEVTKKIERQSDHLVAIVNSMR